MAITPRNKISINFSSVGMTDVVFNLLIFFMLTSTLVHPSALKLLLPKGSNQTSAKPLTTVSVTNDLKYYVELQPVPLEQLEDVLKQKLGNKPDTYISLHADKSVPFENVVNVLNIAQKNNYKLIIATSPK
ncbi:MAG: biopolymer transporter ExbD [Bacteroidetes bacterium GWE2_41_25]|nr:MAG: biopolymer transporter ExbD [Bacteroidetes bacterium GWA2_40_15]OFX94839.1 MAG: biopolymer transporter ExbD [Bacteroidetes bacterium GWC2_40_22]OFY00492.1 MAG: biopolymer transporter ExbD [Bacteroidetes bacterium GWE2_41_25]OFY57559.1 MAG: biopolymer transporter ExbD [Bacteroidetes bacterium GWF2_41_9]HAM10476.1 biopolymer transporter ExbD [Bacteroidales bacterium]